jgi:capsular exopolysaccharide family
MKMSLSHYILLAKRWAWLIILGVVMCGGITYIVTKLTPPVYEATTSLVISLPGSSQYDSAQAALTMQTAYNQLITDPKVLEGVANEHNMPLNQLQNMVSTKPQPNTPIIAVIVDNTDPALATQISIDVAHNFESYADTNLNTQAQFTVIPAVQPTIPIRPKPTTDAIFGALAGLGLALAIIVIFEWIDDRLTAPEEINTLLGIDTLTIIPELSRKQRTQNAEDTPELAEGCRMLCANLNMAQAVRPCKLVMVSSALTGEGKSTIAANMSSFLAMSGKRVLLVDADLRHPVLDQHFQVKSQKGLANAFLEPWKQAESELDGQPTEIPSLRILPAGLLPSNPSELLQSPLAVQLFNYFRTTPKFDYVIFDTSPLLPISDAQIIATYMQITILVIDASHTSRKAMLRAKRMLARTSTRLLGVALNKSKWSEFGAVRDYLGNIQSRPRANIDTVIPPQTPPVSQMTEATATIIISSTNNRERSNF